MKIRILDEVNCRLEGFDYSDISRLQKALSYRRKGAFMEASYQLGISDGKETMISDEGYTYIYYLDEIARLIDERLHLDSDEIEIIDERLPLPELPSNIADVPIDYLSEETGYPMLREQQHVAIRTILSRMRGVLELATNTGKTIICLGVSKRLDPYMKTIITTNSQILVDQTAKDYAKSDLSFAKLDKKVPPKKRQQLIDDHRHIICTSKMFMNCASMFDSSQYCLIIDECHIFGEGYEDTIRFDFNQTPMCIGLTGTLPHDDELKMQKIFATIGGGRLQNVSTKQLTAHGYASTVEVHNVIVKHPSVESHFQEYIKEKMYDWDMEDGYFSKNRERAAAIYEFIQSLPPTNTLVLCHAAFGVMMCEFTGHQFIHKDTPVDERKKAFSRFSEEESAVVFASYGTSATGISENKIFRLIMVEAGPDRKRVIQSVGRAIRLDGVINHVSVYDIGSNTKFAKQQKAKRMKIYKEEGHRIINDTIEIVVDEGDIF